MTTKSPHRLLSFVGRTPLGRKVLFWGLRNIFHRMGLQVLSARYNLVVSPDWPDRLLFYQRIFNDIEMVSGDIVECGVWRGESMSAFAILTQADEIERHIWGFDSFEGLPEPTIEDRESSSFEAEKGWYSGPNQKDVMLRLQAAGIDDVTRTRGVTLVKGWFEDTLPDYQGEIGLLHLDADLYDSTKCALEFLWPKVSVGGVVVLDEYHVPENWAGEKKAVDEYFASSFSDGSAILHEDPISGRFWIKKIR